MPKTSYTFPTPTHLVSFTHEKIYRPKQSYCKQTIKIQCTSDYNNASRYEAVLDADRDFIKYIRKNKKKDIVDLDSRGFLKIMVKTTDGDLETETINVDQIRNVKQKSPLTYSFDNPFKDQIIKDFEKTLKKYNTQKKAEARNERAMGYRLGTVVFTPNNMIQYQIDEQRPYRQFEVSKEDIVSKGYCVRLIYFRSEKLIFGVSYFSKKSGTQVTFLCEFSNHRESSIQIEEGQQLEIYLQDGKICIANKSNKNGRCFDQSMIDSCAGNRCLVFVSLKLPEW